MGVKFKLNNEQDREGHGGRGAGYWSQDGRFGEETGRDCEVTHQFEVRIGWYQLRNGKKGFFDFGWRVSEWLIPIVSCHGGGTMDTNSRGESGTFNGKKICFSVADVLDRLLERQFLLSPWVREKRLRNQLRLVLKDYLEAGPVRRSTVTKLVHDAHQVFPVWRTQIRETMLTSWDQLQNADLEDVANIVFAQFKKPRFPDEIEAGLLFAEHMIEVGQYLMRKAQEKAGRNGKVLSPKAVVSNSKFWYEVRKKINEVTEANRSKRNSLILR